MKYLVIVESPNKTKSIGSYLGKDYKLMASYGHIRGIPKKSNMFNPETLECQYKLLDKANKVVKDLVRAAKVAETVFIATDPDREGEGIAWHLNEEFKKAKIKCPIKRVVFHEITKSAVREAFNHVRDIDINLVHAQQTRNILDYLVGFEISPMLWKSICYGLSAGRVQSPAVRIISERDEEIKQFKPEEYWGLELQSEADGIPFIAKFRNYRGNSGKLDIPNQKVALALIEEFREKEVVVGAIRKKEVKVKPKPPYTTSTLQQDGVRRLSLSSASVMSIAQELFELGMITYMRTDSIKLSDEANSAIDSFVEDKYGNRYLHPLRGKLHKNPNKNSQEAHEAIRPTDFGNEGESLTGLQKKVYQLIRRRALASRMSEAVYESTTVDLWVGEGVFSCSGSVLVFDGYTAVYQDYKEGDEEEVKFPKLEKGQTLPNKGIEAKQHFTQPPAKYNEASLVAKLEKLGIGRPSTYASIITTIKKRGYVNSEGKSLQVTDRGSMVVKYLLSYFGRYVDYQFTSVLEDSLDKIARGELPYKQLLKDFYSTLKEEVGQESIRVKDSGKMALEASEKICPQCQKNLNVYLSKHNVRYLSCTKECGYYESLTKKELVGEQCPECKGELVKKVTKKGDYFVGCDNYPKCSYVKPREVRKIKECPECEEELIVKTFRRGKKSRQFLGCSNYPTCKHSEKFIEDNLESSSK